MPPAIFTSHTAVLGKTGSGKTSTAKLIVEQAVRDGARVCILDPIKSDWFGMTLDSSGKKAGLPFRILGGPYGHVPLHAGAVAAEARKWAGEEIAKARRDALVEACKAVCPDCVADEHVLRHDLDPHTLSHLDMPCEPIRALLAAKEEKPKCEHINRDHSHEKEGGMKYTTKVTCVMRHQNSQA